MPIRAARITELLPARRLCGREPDTGTGRTAITNVSSDRILACTTDVMLNWQFGWTKPRPRWVRAAHAGTFRKGNMTPLRSRSKLERPWQEKTLLKQEAC